MLRYLLILVVHWVLLLPSYSMAENALRTVALSEIEVPGAPNLTYFNDFVTDSVSINDSGHVAFVASTNLPNAEDYHSGIWSEAGGTGLRPIAFSGKSVIHLSGEDTLLEFGRPLLNNNGQIAFMAVGGSDCRGCWIPLIAIEDSPGDLVIVARADWVAPMSNDQATFENVVLHDMNEVGEVLIAGRLNVSLNDHGIWVTDSEHHGRLVGREGDHPPSTAPGTILSNLSGITSSSVKLPLTNSGITAFSTNVDSPAWIGSSLDDLEIIFERGDVVPALGESVTFSGLGQPIVNESGDTVFSANFNVPEVSPEENRAIFRGNKDSGFEILVREGDQAPGLPANIVFTHLLDYSINNDGDLIFEANTNSEGPGSKNGLWLSKSNGELSLVTSQGKSLPGTTSDETFLRTLSSFSFINDLGQIGIRAELTGPNVDDTNNEGIWVQDIGGQFQLIAREGQQIQIQDDAGTSLRTIAGLGFIDERSMNSKGQIAFTAEFTDGSRGVFVSSLVAVPEPNSSLLLFSILLTFGILRSREKH